MKSEHPIRVHSLLAGALALAMLAACGGQSPPPAAATPTTDAAPADLAAAAGQASQALEATATTWSPEALEDLLAPVALYPDPVLLQVLVAATNPQEVLDAGNWLIANPDLAGKPLETGAEKAGFTVPMRALMQFPEVVDKLCLNMLWTEELGQAYVNDQQGVMDAIQRLRAQAQDVGSLQSSPQMKVETKQQDGKEVITVSPPSPQVVYVPQYNPQTVYAPAPAAAPATTTTTTTTTEKGHSTGSMVATGVLAFGAGLLVAEIFDDDDDYYGNGYYGGMYGRPMPYYPPYPYRPSYGNGFYPGGAYNRPPTYIRGGNTIVVNQNNNYSNRYGNSQQVARNRSQPRSPITAAKSSRPELQQLNAKAAQGPARRPPPASEAWKGKGGYAGSDPKVQQSMDRQASKAQKAQSDRSTSRVQGSYAGANPATRQAQGRPAAPATVNAKAPKMQGGYAGAKPAREKPAAPAARPSTPSRNAARPPVASQNQARPASSQNRPTADRGRPQQQAQPQARPQQARPAPANNSAMSRGSGGGASAKAASARGKQSMPAGGASKARSGGKQQRAR